MVRALSQAAHRLPVCEAFFGFDRLFGFKERGTGALSVRCTAPTLLMGLAWVLWMVGGFYFAFGFALWNQERLSRSDSNSQRS